jgi:DNA-binding transcriptional ArsR family regulator
MLNQQVDTVLQALADSNRRQIVERLVDGPASVSELAEPFAMSLSAVMQHLAVLEACGLVRSEKQGRVRTCYLETEPLRVAEGWFSGQRSLWEHRLDRLGSFLEEDAQPHHDSQTKGTHRHEQPVRQPRHLHDPT